MLSLSYFKRHFNFIMKKKKRHFTLCSFIRQVQCCCLQRKDTKSSACSRVRNELHWRWVGFPGCSAQYFILASLRLLQVFVSSCTLCWCRYQVVCYSRERNRKCNSMFYFMLPKLAQTHPEWMCAALNLEILCYKFWLSWAFLLCP